MNRSVIWVVSLVLLVGIVWFLWRKVGNFGPALLPPKEDIVDNLEKQSIGLSPSFPLKLPDGFKIGIFAKDLGNARDLEFSVSGTLLISIPSDGKVVALPDKNGDGVADSNIDVLTSLGRPHGIAFHDGKLFVAEETRVVRYLWDEENLKATQEKVLFDLPKGGRHSTRTISFNQKGQTFVSIGSSCDVCYEKHEWLAAVIVSDADGNVPRVWAKGLRNSVFITVNPKTGELWGTEMGRDFLGDDLPPDEVNIIREGGDYGWPDCYGKKIIDTTQPQKGTPCEATEAPVYEITAHSAPLGLVFIQSKQFPSAWQGDLLVAYHGSWNRSTPIGYKVVRLDVEGRPRDQRLVDEEDFITGFLPSGGELSGPSQAYGRPVDLTFDKEGSLYISDDKAGVVYKVVKQ